MKIRLRVYQHKGTLRNELKTLEEARRVADLMSQKYPGLLFEPHMEAAEKRIIDLSELEKDNSEELSLWKGLPVEFIGSC